MNTNDKYKVLLVNLIIITFIDIFTKNTLVYCVGHDFIRLLFPFILFVTQGCLLLLTEVTKYQAIKNSKTIKIKY